MSNKYIYRPQIAIHPGQHLREILESQHISQTELSQRTGIARKQINEIINKKARISAETAQKLEPVLELPSSYWLNLQANYDATVKRLEEFKRIEQSDDFAEEREWLKCINYEQLVKYGLTEPANTVPERIYNLRKSAKVSNLTQLNNLSLKGAARRASVIGNTKEDLLWRQIAFVKASKIKLKKFSKEKIWRIAETLRYYSTKDINCALKSLSLDLSGCGIALVVMPHLKNSGFNGYTEKIHNGYMVVVTLRGKSADGFWFSLLHEISHILLGHIDNPTSDKKIKKQRENDADQQAADFLIKPSEFKQFDIQRAHSEKYIRYFAQKIGIHPCIIRGRLCKDGVLQYYELNNLRQYLKFVE